MRYAMTQDEIAAAAWSHARWARDYKRDRAKQIMRDATNPPKSVGEMIGRAVANQIDAMIIPILLEGKIP